MVSISIPTQLRGPVGTKQAKLERRSGLIPAVIYGKKSEPIHINVTMLDVKNLIYSPDFKIAEINVDGTIHKCIVKAKQFHPVNDSLIHIDFLKLTDGQKVKVDVPVKFFGTSPGVKSGGKLIQLVRKVTLKTTPEKLIDEVKVDISGLELGGVLRIKSIEIPEGVEIIANSSIPIANVEVPRALKSAAAEEKKAAGKK
ncbi:MAG: 50S ribosomal protein L25 [Saprospiraceae bacterium]|nr:50S ribosomal protein L25 [Saprospiraceae bacterium]